jgi:hypothetical protein
MLLSPSDVLNSIVFFQDPTFNFLGHHTNSNKKYHYLVLHVLSLRAISNDNNKIGLCTKFFARLKHHDGVNLGLLYNGGGSLIFGIIDNSECI